MLNNEQTQELRRLKQYFPYRIVFGVIDKETGKFVAYTKTTKHTANKLAREGHQVFVLQ
jgi:hypothetical protein